MRLKSMASNRRINSLFLACIALMFFAATFVLVTKLDNVTKYGTIKMGCPPFPAQIDPFALLKSQPNATADRVKNIVFLKTNKCASSTLQNVLFRFIDNNDLILAPPSFLSLGHPEPFSRSFIPEPKVIRYSKNYSLIAHNAVFNYEEMEAVMPRGSTYITILRDPVEQYRSMFSYYQMGLQVTGERRVNISEYLDILERKTTSFLNWDTRLFGRYGRNQMSFDLGMSPNDFDEETYVRSHVKYLDSKFDLVLMSDRMDESLILMKNHFRWSTDDVVVFRHNAQSDERKELSKLDAESRDKVLQMNGADVILFEYFSQKFDERVRMFGKERMAKEVDELNRLSSFYHRKCVVEESIDVEFGDICHQLTLPSLLYTERLITLQANYFPDFYNLGILRRLIISFVIREDEETGQSLLKSYKKLPL